MQRGVRLSLLVLAAAHVAAGLPWLFAHGFHVGLEEGGWHEHDASPHPAEMALEILLHGHAHPRGAPRHAHEAPPAGAFRHDQTELQAPVDLVSGQPALSQALLRSFKVARSVLSPGAGPPSGPYWLCILLI